MGFVRKAVITIFIIYGIGLGITLLVYLCALLFQAFAVAAGLPPIENPFVMLFNASWAVTVFTFIAPVGVSAFTTAMVLDWFMPTVLDFVETIWNGIWYEVFGLSAMKLQLDWVKTLPTVSQAITDLATFIKDIKPEIAV